MAETLPANWYVDDAVHARERRAIFAPNWCLFAPEADFAGTGDWRAERVNGWPIFVIRGKDGVLRGFHNVCRHRAAALLADGQGSCNMLRCPYHRWTYDLAGRLKVAPDFGDDPGFDRAEYGLFALRVETWRGLVFVCIDEGAPDLLAWLGTIPDLCARYPGPPELTLGGEFTVTGAANWKTYCDNTVEGYHLPTVHQRLAAAVVADAVEIRPYDDGRLVAFHVPYAGAADGARLRGADGLWFYRFPGFQVTASARAFKAERIEPDGPGRLKSLNWMWFADVPAAERDAAFAWAREIVAEDMGICETVQRNLAVGVYTAGRLSPAQESNVVEFQNQVLAALGAPPEPVP